MVTGDLQYIGFIGTCRGRGPDLGVCFRVEERGVSTSHADAETWVRAELLNRLQIKRLPSGDQLMDLAHQAVAFMEELKSTGRLGAPLGSSGKNMERDVAVAWILTEAAKLAMTVSPSEITRLISLALQEKAPASA